MTRARRASVFALALGAILLAAPRCQRVTDAPSLDGQDLHLTVLHTSDIHSRLLPYEQVPGLIDRGMGLCAELQPFGGIARLNYLLARERARSQRILHLDSGDCFQGAPIFNQFKGEVEIRTMAQMRPDGVALGNHEFDLGSFNLALQYERWGHNLYPLLAANYQWVDKSDPNSHGLGDMVKPYAIRNLQGLRVAIIGMGNTSSMTSISLGQNSLGITPMEVVEATRTWVEQLRHHVDLILVVSHLGLTASAEVNVAEDTQLITGYDRVVPKHAVQPNWTIIGEEPTGEVRVRVPGVVGIDAIFGGHLHIVLNPPKVLVDDAGRKVPLVHSGAFAKFLGRVDFVVHVPGPDEDAPFGAEITSHRYQLFPISNRIPKKSKSAVVPCPGCDDSGVCALTDDVEAGDDTLDLGTVCGAVADAQDERRICEEADRCRQLQDACSSECRKARAECKSVPAPVDVSMLELLDPYIAELYREQNLAQAFAVATDRISRFGLSGEDSPLGNLVADSMRLRNRVEAQFSLTNSLGIRTNMEAGPVTIEEMYNIFPFENSLTTMFLAGTEVQELLDYVTLRSANRGCQTQAQVSGVTFTMHCRQALRNVDAPACGTSDDCPDDFRNAGTKNPVRCVNNRCFKSPAEDIQIQGQPLISTENYRLATNDFLGRGGSGFDVLRRNTTKTETSLALREGLIDFMKSPPERGGPGRTCGSPYLMALRSPPTRPEVRIKKSIISDASCERTPKPNGCVDGKNGLFVRCEEDEEEVRFFCVPYDFATCEDLGRVTPVFFVREGDGEAGELCNLGPDRSCPGQLHCCERELDDRRREATFFCVVPYCVAPPETGRIQRIVE